MESIVLGRKLKCFRGDFGNLAAFIRRAGLFHRETINKKRRPRVLVWGWCPDAEVQCWAWICPGLSHLQSADLSRCVFAVAADL